ncbi:putative activity regulator of membrane protease YbbK [Methylophaga thiooxydans]|uniref:Putative activity regulator of membrane protease YbbK n=1 Tax=Methylophaga thiooxydans TaxID=392484 RepID=A0A0A0BD19_9GAMM|nr:NfeD family protein [Methylophaga thiooxydans]KGM06468.1 putative activity regulator of membrane protease YbbK [Methylophaga thiooxydans]
MPFVIDFWHWWIFAVVLVTIEILAPSFFALWLGIAAFLTGLALLLFPQLGWEYQLMLFAVLSVLSIVMWRHYYLKNPIVSDQPNLNRRGAQYIGRTVTLSAPIADGVGKIKLDDSTWKVRGPDCAAGKKVRITGLDNVVFTVEVIE